MARNKTVLCSCCDTLVNERTERRHRNSQSRPRVNIALAAARRNLVTLSGISKRTAPSQRNRGPIQNDAASNGTGGCPPNPTDSGNNSFSVVGNESLSDLGGKDFDIVMDGYGDIGNRGVVDARCMWRAPRMEDSEGEEEAGSADEIDDESDIGENAKQDDDEDEDEFLPSLSAWDALGQNFEQELANISERAIVNCIFFS
jgi:hypothetical protein